MISHLNNCKKYFPASFLPLFANFCQFFPAMDNFLGPLLSYLAENSAIWH
jgi:hypothetical protein